MNKKIILGILMSAIFIASGFAIAVDSSGSSTAPAVNTAYAVNDNSSIASQFASWYMKEYPNSGPSQVANMNTSQRDTVFAEFLHSDVIAQKLISERNKNSIAKFNVLDHESAVTAFNSIINNGAPAGYRMELESKNGSTVTSLYVHSGTITSAIVHIRPDLPNGVSDSGEWVMVSVNYFVYHAPWWLGGWSVTYGEHDVINALYAGVAAQKYYNTVTEATTVEAILDDVALGVLGIALPLAIPSLGTSAVVGAIVAAALVAAGATVGVLAAIWVGDYTKLYESTYANEPAGNKYMWIYDTINYYYPWITVVGSFASSIGMYGYLSNMNVVTIIPNIPFIEFGGYVGVEIAASLSGYAHNIAKKVGWNEWAYTGN